MTKRQYYILAELIAGEKMAKRMLEQWNDKEWDSEAAKMEIHELKEDREYIARLGR
jgi:hypothetical protein